jgi:dCTP deaminase
MLLSNTDIIRYRELGAVVIEPFHEVQLNNVSYDLTLGDEIARYRKEREMFDLSEDNPREMFEIEQAAEPRPMNRTGTRGFYLAAGERVLARSREIAGGCQIAPTVSKARCGCTPMPGSVPQRCKNYHGPAVAVTTSLHATSTAARIGIHVCACAGWGDVGFLSPWIYELQNMAPRALWIPVGAVLAQVSFHKVSPILDGTSYEQIGSYQAKQDVETTLQTWRLKDGLPKFLKVR